MVTWIFFSASERRVDVLQEDDGVLGGVRQAMLQSVVGHPAVGEVQDADRIFLEPNVMNCNHNFCRFVNFFSDILAFSMSPILS
jgi:hypothetical protein